ncbi:carbohydrate ABC transporter permease [Saccharomonospora azurea]|uniref:carbohydrate ABC transporter permease n=1 Tax=Saccharomonospora azurea TaxID=40988 RepID=UPI002409B727|nr:carbohydrate ABC transporter permease [Saccharomonospora azurea]
MKLGRASLTAFTWLIAVLFVFPVVWMVVTAFKREADAYTDPPSVVFTPTWEQFAGVFERGFLPYLANSAFVTVTSTVFVLLLGIPAAYALSLAPIKRTENALGFFLSTKMLPIVAAIIPLYVISQNVRLLDHVWALVVLYTAMNLPLAVWMMRSFLLEVPREIIEAARIDGASLPMLLRRVVLPVVAPGIAATALICVIFSWTEFFYAINLTAARAGTVPVFLSGFITSEGLYWAQLSAAALLASLPVMIVGWIAQKHLVRGLSMGAVK